MVTLTEESFDSLILNDATDTIHIVQLSTTTCAKCKILGYTLPPFLERYYPQVNLVEGDVVSLRDIVSDYDIRSVPSLLVFRSGSLLAKLTGDISVEVVRNVLDEALR